MQKFNEILMRIEKAIGSFLLGVLFVIIVVNVISRYFLNYPIPWSDELVAYLYVWSGFLAGAYIMGDDSHIRINILEDRFPPKMKLFTRLVLNLLTLIVFAYLIPSTISTFPTLGKSLSMRINLKYVYTILPLAFALFVLHLLHSMYVEWKELKLLQAGNAAD